MIPKSCIIAAALFAALPVLGEPLYPHNREPLRPTRFVKLPLGAVKAEGWLKDQLTVQANGLTGHLDEFWDSLKNSAWKGGDGEAWERGPYYLDGLVPLAYTLDDERLKEKCRPWLEWMMNSRLPNGWFGPEKNGDRWPLAVAMKVMAQYYEASGDERALAVIRNYFRYLHQNPPDWPQKEWRGVRAMENALTGIWLYRLKGNPSVLDVNASIFNNSFDWGGYFLNFPWTAEALAAGEIPLNWDGDGLTAHVVNVAMAVKYPALWWQQSGDERYKKAVYAALENLDRHHGQAGGRFSGDEHLSGKSPAQGTELCAVVEFMFSLENLIEIFGDPAFADRLEMLAYNANPGACTADYWAHQYDQQTNQVLCTVAKRNWSTNGDWSNIFGLEPNYGCCTANMHQGWPKFVSHLWMATPDRGLAAAAYGPSRVTAKVADGANVTIREITDYPFDGTIRFRIETEKPVAFPLYLRVPGWAEGAEIEAGGSVIHPEAGQYIAVRREWKDGGEAVLRLPMKIRTETRFNNAVSVLRGPLVFGLKIGARKEELQRHHDTLPVIDWAVHPTTPWNYALEIDPERPEEAFEAETREVPSLPFDPANPPVVLRARGAVLPSWTLKDNSAADPPPSPVQTGAERVPLELVPYASGLLRIGEFPHTPPLN